MPEFGAQLSHAMTRDSPHARNPTLPTHASRMNFDETVRGTRENTSPFVAKDLVDRYASASAFADAAARV